MDIRRRRPSYIIFIELYSPKGNIFNQIDVRFAQGWTVDAFMCQELKLGEEFKLRIVVPTGFVGYNGPVSTLQS